MEDKAIADRCLDKIVYGCQPVTAECQNPRYINGYIRCTGTLGILNSNYQPIEGLCISQQYCPNVAECVRGKLVYDPNFTNRTLEDELAVFTCTN